MPDRVLMKGNEAIAEAALRAGCRHYFGYPITPQTEISAHLAKRMPELDGTFLQAESEIAAIHMVYGVAATGKRTMTSSSSPGISLKSEGLSYLAGADLPAVVVNVQRGGPGLGGIQPAQSDYFQATRGSGHGDYHMVVLAPASVQEMADLTVKGFEIADRYRITSMILADGTLGQMMEPVTLPEPTESTVDKPWALTGTRKERTHNVINSLYLNTQELEQTNIERYERYAQIKETEAMAVTSDMDDADICIVAYGIAARIAYQAIAQARAEGIKVGMVRPVTLWPFPDHALKEAARTAKHFVSVELSMGQMIDDIRLAIECKHPVTLVNRVGGMVPTAEEIVAHLRTLQVSTS